jgi:hypothetical protein
MKVMLTMFVMSSRHNTFPSEYVMDTSFTPLIDSMACFNVYIDALAGMLGECSPSKYKTIWPVEALLAEQ